MNRSKLLTGALVIVLVLLAGGSWLLFGSSTGLNFANADQYTAGDTEISSAVENLDIEWTSGAVNLEYHAGSGVTVSETANRTLSEDEKLRWWMDGNTLRVRYCKSGLNIHFNLNKVLTVSLPEGTALKKSNIDVTSADVNVRKSAQRSWTLPPPPVIWKSGRTGISAARSSFPPPAISPSPPPPLKTLI